MIPRLRDYVVTSLTCLLERDGTRRDGFVYWTGQDGMVFCLLDGTQDMIIILSCPALSDGRGLTPLGALSCYNPLGTTLQENDGCF